MPRPRPEQPAPRSLTYIRLCDLPPAFRNPKLHDRPAMVESLLAYGFTNPVLVDERTQRLVAGHGRREALIDLKGAGGRIPDGILVDDDGEWLVPAIRGWASKNDHHAEAYVIADNRLTEAGGWHMQTLAAMLEDVQVFDPTLLDTMGYDADGLDEVLRRGFTDSLGGLEGVFEAPTAPPKGTDPGELAPEGDNTVSGPTPNTDPPPGEVTTAPRLFEVDCPACQHHFTAPAGA